jgi:hypothetical protein
MSTETLKTQIADLTERYQALVRQREGLDRQIETTKIRLDAFQEAYVMVGGQAAASNGQDGSTAAPKARVRPTLLNPLDPWDDALQVLRAKGRQFTTDDIIAEAESRGSDIDRVKARSRLAHLVDRKSLVRVREGVFEFPGAAA